MNLHLIWEFETGDVGQIEHVAKKVKELCSLPCILLLEGPLGAGKTTFVQHLFNGIEIKSPTYSIIHEYESFIHGDFYRLKSPAELEDLELDNYAQISWIIIEWGNDYWPQLSEIFFKHSGKLLKILPIKNNQRKYQLFKITK